ncbi:ankyrin repeat protein [Ophiostoma piceae UAMH 11346]|uniref:Ankyrin repeat protein n=1 Tax=Ophiostoma piceae (strain UAMH 11346) TaxID=1262450 RepID=S3CSL5_OPHP1|nr:ankyrin repeat protein [Ophiostoma piceae UAMH 11346]
MDGLSIAANAAGIVSLGVEVTKALLKYYKDYKDREADLASTTKKLDRLFGMLETLASHLEGPQSLSKDKVLLDTVQSAVQDCEECIDDLQSQCDRFKDIPSASIKAKAITAARKLSYPLRRSTLDAIDETVDEIVSHISLALQVIQQKSIDQVQNEAEEIKALLQLVQANQVSRGIHDWLAAPDVSSNYYAACRSRHSGTGNWLVKGEAFSTWLNSANSFLWLYGFAGCGKSVLCSTAIQQVFRHRKSNPQTAIAFFFFTFNDNSKQDVSAMLRAIVLQLSGQIKGGDEMLSRLREDHKTGKAPDEVLIAYLQQLIWSSEETYILIDALDESPRDSHRWRLLQVLIDMREWSEDRLHLLVTSRDEPDIREAITADMNTRPEQMVSLKNSSVDGDIAAFISGALENDRRLRKWADFHDHIKGSLTKRAKGVFRWVECQIVTLASTARSKRQLDAVLTALPRSLDETYERMLGNIAEESKDDARRLLTLLCYSLRPLTVAEVIEGIAVELSDNPRLNTDGRLEGEEDILQLCPGLVEIDHHTEVFPAFQQAVQVRRPFGMEFLGAEDDFDIYPDSFRSTVRIAHFSVQEYLESKRILDRPVSGFGVQFADAHAEIASVCLTYLLGLPSSRWHHEYALALYAARCWAKHYRDANICKYGVQSQALQLLGPDSSKRSIWKQLLKNADRHEESSSPITYVSYFGLHSLLLGILNLRPYCDFSPEQVAQLVNAEAETSVSVLRLGVLSGSFEVVKTLVQRGAHVNTKGRSPLMDAIAEGHDEIARFLIDHGADLLETAHIHSDKAMVELLIAELAGSNARGTGMDTSQMAIPGCEEAEMAERDARISRILQKVASSNFNFKYATLFLGKGLTLNLDYAHLIKFLAKLDDAKAMQLLSDKGLSITFGEANPHYRNFDETQRRRRYRAALLHAARYEVAVLLVNSDILGPGVDYSIVLKSIVNYGNEAAVRLLIESGADVNIHSGYYGTALQAAADNGHEKIVRLLIESGADVNIQSGYYGTALQAAAKNGHEETVRLLIESGADINIQFKDHGSALQAAARSGHEGIVRLLIKSGADVNINSSTALQAAASYGREEIVRLLIESGADVNFQYKDCGTALLVAAINGCEKIVRLLIESGADVSIQSGKYGTALHAAASHARAEIVRLLIESGADVNFQSGYHGTALQAAATRWYKSIIMNHLHSSRSLTHPTRAASFSTETRPSTSKHSLHPPTMAQTPEQRRRNLKFAKDQDARRGKSETDLKRRTKDVQKSPISPVWLGVLAFVVFGGLVVEVFSRFFL